MIIEKGRAVVIGYELKLNNGEVVDSCTSDDPLTFIYGRGQMLPSFEKNLAGKKKGDQVLFTLNPEEGYGTRDENAVMTMPKTMFPPHVAEGMIFEAETPDGQQALLRVTGTEGENVMVDANHPMAGETLNFKVQVIEVREPTAEDEEDEDDHGHDHDHDHDHGDDDGGHQHGPGCSHNH